MDSKERFTNRVENYTKYRPSYPREAIDHLYNVVGLQSNSIVADVGAGTGIFSRLLLERGSQVIAGEPNEAMRNVAEQLLSEFDNFEVSSGSAEATGLPDASVDFIVCAQAFHWFDMELARIEFGRILRPGGQVVLIWNARLTEGTPFLDAYESLLRTHAIDYVNVSHRNVRFDTLVPFFEVRDLHVARFTYSQTFDFEGVKGRLFSSSYAPTPDHPNHEPMINELRAIFDDTKKDGEVSFDYETIVYWGRVAANESE